ncbi:MAG: hypothetical protein QW479_07260 [Desulfurococcaceae archaeon]
MVCRHVIYTSALFIAFVLTALVTDVPAVFYKELITDYMDRSRIVKC